MGSSTLPNSRIALTFGALQAVGMAKMPIPLALKMAEAKQALEAQSERIQEIEKRCRKELGDPDRGAPGWAELVETLNDLVAEEFTIPFRFTLYRRGEEFSWSESFKSKLDEMEPNVLHGLLAVTDIVEVEPKE